jgi:hypothetical protein
MDLSRWGCLLLVLHLSGAMAPLRSAQNVYLTEVPDYDWWAGCFGTATGNLMGFWDRHGFPDFYTGPTAGGIAPLNTAGNNAGIRSLWASQAGVDGRAGDQPGHLDDYYVAFQSTAADPYLALGRAEHAPDCLGDFVGLSQDKFPDLDGECSGNVDGYSFAYWDKTGDRRVNHLPQTAQGQPTVDLPSGLRAWTQWRGSEAEVFTQLSAFHPDVPPGKGFAFADVKAEIDRGYPFLVFLQSYQELSRPRGMLPRANPNIHGMLIYGYYADAAGAEYVRCRTSWASGDRWLEAWSAQPWIPEENLSVRGVIGYRPSPRIREVSRTQGRLRVTWEGPLAKLYDAEQQTVTPAHAYLLEMTRELGSSDFVPLGGPVSALQLVVNDPGPGNLFLRLQLMHPGAETHAP